MKIDGITLLQMIKAGKVKNHTKINVLFDDGLVFDLVSILNYKHNDLKWEPGTFQVAMLYDDYYKFEIIQERKKIEPLDIKKENAHYFLVNENGTRCVMSTHSRMIAQKLNEVIEEVNLLKKEDEKMKESKYDA